MSELLIGTSSWTAASWVGPFYPPGTRSADFLPHYAGEFPTVEIDATWYGIPSPRTVEAWRHKTPESFQFAAKVPRLITHDRVLVDCLPDLDDFLAVMRRLGPKLGPLLLQFPYFNRDVLPNLDVFLERLRSLLRELPTDVRFALETRNRSWLRPELFALLREHRIVLAWPEMPSMPTAKQWLELPGAITSDLLYVRLLGDRHGIERITKSWDALVVERTREIAAWADVARETFGRLSRAYFYVNNHYAGCGYQTARQLREALGDAGRPVRASDTGTAVQPALPFS